MLCTEMRFGLITFLTFRPVFCRRCNLGTCDHVSARRQEMAAAAAEEDRRRRAEEQEAKEERRRAEEREAEERRSKKEEDDRSMAAPAPRSAKKGKGPEKAEVSIAPENSSFSHLPLP